MSNLFYYPNSRPFYNASQEEIWFRKLQRTWEKMGGTEEFTTTKIRWGEAGRGDIRENLIKDPQNTVKSKRKTELKGKIREEVPESNELVCPLFVSDACSHTHWQMQNVFHRIWPAVASSGGRGCSLHLALSGVFTSFNWACSAFRVYTITFCVNGRFLFTTYILVYRRYKRFIQGLFLRPSFSITIVTVIYWGMHLPQDPCRSQGTTCGKQLCPAICVPSASTGFLSLGGKHC